MNSRLRDRYVPRLLGNAWSSTVSWATLRTVGGGLLVLAAIVAVTTVVSGEQDKIAEAAQNLTVTVLATLVVGAIYLVLNLLLAPWRLDRALRAELEADRRTTSARIELIEAERDEAQRALDQHLAATAVTVDVRVVTRVPLATVDVSDASIEAWLQEQRESFGGPPPPPEPRPEPAPGSSLSTTAKMIQAITMNAGAFGALTNALEPRTPAQFRKEVADWLTAARPGAREELLRLGLMAQIATVQVFAENTGRRHLSEVRVTLRFRIGALVESAYGSRRSSRLPERPRAWAEQAYSRSAFLLGIDRKYDPTVAVFEGSDDVVVELGPNTVPPGNEEQVGFLVLAIPRPPAGSSIDGTWRVTAREAEGDSTGSFRLEVGAETLGHDALREATQALLDR